MSLLGYFARPVAIDKSFTVDAILAVGDAPNLWANAWRHARAEKPHSPVQFFAPPAWRIGSKLRSELPMDMNRLFLALVLTGGTLALGGCPEADTSSSTDTAGDADTQTDTADTAADTGSDTDTADTDTAADTGSDTDTASECASTAACTDDGVCMSNGVCCMWAQEPCCDYCCPE